jgi:excinuclease ABC subunit B
MAADVEQSYTASPKGEDLETLIRRAREDMERAAKALDFTAAARFRDRMYELQQLREEQLNKSQF